MTQRTLVQTEDASLSRDPDSKALLTVDTAARDQVRRVRRQASEMAALRAQLQELQNKVMGLERLREELATLRQSMTMVSEKN